MASLTALDIAQANLNCAAALLTSLVHEGGVRHLVLSPGARSAPVVVVATQLAPRLQLYPILDERAAAFFALQLRAQQSAGVVLLCTSGSAGAHYLPALLEAAASLLPLVVLTCDRPVALQASHALQTTEQMAMFGRAVHFFIQAELPQSCTPNSWRHVARMLMAHAEQPPTGPVHANLPFSEPLWQPHVALPSALPPNVTEQAPPCRPSVAVGTPRAEFTADMAASWLQRLRSAPSGAFVVGPCKPHDWTAALAQVAQSLAWPILAEPTSQLRFSPHVQQETLATSGLLHEYLPEALPKPAWIVRLGVTPLCKGLTKLLASSDKVISIDPGPVLADPQHCVDSWLRCDIGHLLAQWAAQLQADNLPANPSAKALLQRYVHAEQWLQSWLSDFCQQHFFGGSIVRSVVTFLPTGSLLYIGNSMTSRHLDYFAPSRPTAIRVASQRGLNGIDGNLAGLCGARVAWPATAPVVGIVGDLTFLHDVGGLRLHSLCQAKNLLLVVINNQGGGIFDALPIAAIPRGYTDFFRLNHQEDLTAWGQAAGWQVISLDNMAMLESTIGSALLQPQATLLVANINTQTHLQLPLHLREAWRNFVAYEQHPMA